MGNEDVNIKISADNEQARVAIERIADSLEKMGSKGKESAAKTSEVSGALDGVIGKYAALGTVMMGATEIIDKFREATSKMREEADRSAQSVDASFRRLAVQAGRLSPVDKAGVAQAAHKYAVSFDQASETSKRLISTGFSPDEATGGALDTALATAAATTSTDPAQTAEALSMYLAATGQKKTTANLKAAGLQFQTLFHGTNVQAGDIQELAGSTAAVSTMGVAPGGIMPAFSVLREQLGAAQASTGFKSITTSLATAAGSEKAMSALASLGIDPKEVDLSRDMETTFRRLKEGMASVDRTTGNIALNDIFGRRGMGAASVLMQNVDKLAERQGPGDQAGYDEALGIAITGPAAEARRAQESKLQAYAGRKDYQGKALVREELEASLVRQGAGAFETTTGLMSFDINTKLGMSARSAVGRATDSNILGTSNDLKGDLNNPSSDLMRALQQIEENTRPKEITITSDAGSVPARTRASQAGQ